MGLPQPNVKVTRGHPGIHRMLYPVKVLGLCSLSYQPKRVQKWWVVEAEDNPSNESLFLIRWRSAPSFLTDGDRFWYLGQEHDSGGLYLAPVDYFREICKCDVIQVKRAIKNWMAENLNIGKIKTYPKPTNRRRPMKGGLD